MLYADHLSLAGEHPEVRDVDGSVAGDREPGGRDGPLVRGQGAGAVRGDAVESAGEVLLRREKPALDDLKDVQASIRAEGDVYDVREASCKYLWLTVSRGAAISEGCLRGSVRPLRRGGRCKDLR